MPLPFAHRYPSPHNVIPLRLPQSIVPKVCHRIMHHSLLFLLSVRPRTSSSLRASHSDAASISVSPKRLSTDTPNALEIETTTEKTVPVPNLHNSYMLWPVYKELWQTRFGTDRLFPQRHEDALSTYAPTLSVCLNYTDIVAAGRLAKRLGKYPHPAIRA